MHRTVTRLRGLLGELVPQPHALPASPAAQQSEKESIFDILESVPVFVKEPAAAAAQRAALHRRVRAAQGTAQGQARNFIKVDHDTDVRTQKAFIAKFLSREMMTRLKVEAAAGFVDTRLQRRLLSEAHKFMEEACSDGGTGMTAGAETLASFLRLAVLVGKGRVAARFAAGPEFAVANVAQIRWNHSVYAQMVAAYSQARMYPQLANLYRKKVKTKVRAVEAEYFTALTRAAKRDGALRILEPELSQKHQSPDGRTETLPLLLEAVTRSPYLRNESFGYASCLAAATSQAQCEAVVCLLLEKGLVALSQRAGSVAAAPAPADAKRSRHVSRVSIEEADLQAMLLKKANRWKLAAWGDRLYNEGVGYLHAGGVPGGMPQPTVAVSRAMLMVHGTFQNFAGLQEVFQHAGDLLAARRDGLEDRTGLLEAYIRGCAQCTTARHDTAHASGNLCFEACLVSDTATISPMTYRVVCEMAIRYRDTATLTLALDSASQGGLRLLQRYSSLREPVRRLYLETNTTPPPSVDVTGKTAVWAH